MTDELPGDLWAYRRQCDESRWRFAMFAVWSAVPDAPLVEVEGDEVVVTMVVPWWSSMTLGAWTWHRRGVAMREIVERTTVLCGWCPKVRFK